MAIFKDPGAPCNVFIHHLQHDLLHKRQHQCESGQPDGSHAHRERLLRKAGRLIRQLLPKDHLQNLSTRRPYSKSAPQQYSRVLAEFS